MSSDAQPATDTSDTKAAGAGDVYEQRAADLRSTAKWLITTFGALGAALIASLQLSQLSDTHGWHLALSLIGFGLGIVGSLIAIAWIAQVLVSAPPPSTGLVTPDVEKDPEGSNVSVLGGFASVEMLSETWKSALTERRAAYAAYLTAFQNRKTAQDHGEDPAKVAELKRLEDASFRRHEVAVDELKLAQPAVQRLLDFADLFEVRRRFQRAFVAVIVGVVLAAVGVGIFAAAVATKPDSSTSTAASTPAVQTPVLGKLDIEDSHQDEFSSMLGAQCDLNQVAVDVLAADEHAYDLAVLPENGCTAARVEMPVSEGFVGGGAVELPTTTTAPESPKPPLSP